FFLLVLGAVLTFLIPKFKEIFETFGAQLPTPTIILIGISDFLKRNIVYELGFLITFIASFKIISNTEKGKSLIDYIKLKLPGLGPLILKSYIIKFCSTLSTLVSNGVTLVQALEISGETTENVIFRREIEKIKKGVVEGKKFSNLMSDSSIFPEVMVKMIEIGEESGSLDMMLKKVSEFYRRQLDAAISGLTSLIEPVIMVLLGIFAMAVVIALYLPIFKISGTIR
ncbi:MAG: type II secretion system F family protein, partial [Fidelibacterota bacterium]